VKDEVVCLAKFAISWTLTFFYFFLIVLSKVLNRCLGSQVFGMVFVVLVSISGVLPSIIVLNTFTLRTQAILYNTEDIFKDMDNKVLYISSDSGRLEPAGGGGKSGITPNPHGY